MLLLDAAHHHAKMAGLDDHPDALRFDYFLNRLGDLGGEALLDLQPPGKEFDETRHFAEADHFAVRDVGYVHLAEERQHVVLTQTKHFDVFDDDHLVVSDIGRASCRERV